MKNVLIFFTISFLLTFSHHINAMERASEDDEHVTLKDLETYLELKEYKHLLSGLCGIGKNGLAEEESEEVQCCDDESNSECDCDGPSFCAEKNCCGKYCCDTKTTILCAFFSIWKPMILPAMVLTGMAFNNARPDLIMPAFASWGAFGASFFAAPTILALWNSSKNLGTYFYNKTMTDFINIYTQAIDANIRIPDYLIKSFAPLIFKAERALLEKLDPNQAIALYFADKAEFERLIKEQAFCQKTLCYAIKFSTVQNMPGEEKRKFLAGTSFKDLLNEFPDLEQYFAAASTDLKQNDSEPFIPLLSRTEDRLVVKVGKKEYFIAKHVFEKWLSQDLESAQYSTAEIKKLMALSKLPESAGKYFSIRREEIDTWLEIYKKSHSAFLLNKCEECCLLCGVPRQNSFDQLQLAINYGLENVKQALIANLRYRFKTLSVEQHDFHCWKLLGEDKDFFKDFDWQAYEKAFKKQPRKILSWYWHEAKINNIRPLLEAITTFAENNPVTVAEAWDVTPKELRPKIEVMVD